jgi:hypothetical protein
VFTQILPAALRRVLGVAAQGAGRPAGFKVDTTSPGLALLTLSGDWRGSVDGGLRLALARVLRDGRRIEIDLSHGPAMGSAMWALLALVDAWQGSPRAIRADTLKDRSLRAELHAHGMQFLLHSPSD